MAKHKIIIILAVFFSVALASQRPPYMPPKFPLRKPGMTAEEYHKETQKFFEHQMRQKRDRNKEYMNLMARQAWMRLLRVSERQWKTIESKYDKVHDLELESWVGAAGYSHDRESFHWKRASNSPYHPMEYKSHDEMPEGYRIVEELINLLEDEKSTDQQIRKKIDNLQQVREKAREALTQAKKELTEILTTPRQEAIFLILGHID